MPGTTLISRTIRNANRTREILSVLIRYGFDDVVQDLGIDRLIEKGKRLVTSSARPNEEIRRLPRSVRLRQAMEELGPTFVKMGQILSTRPDLIPPDWAEEFAQLQDNVQSVPFEKIRDRLEQEFPDRLDELFAKIDERPLAAGSIAQVHRATLASGEDIVLKVLRPGIREVLDSDMEILRWLAEFAESRFEDLGYSPTDVVEEFSRELNREIDLTNEARAMNRMSRAFEDSEAVRFPIVYRHASTDKVLAMEEVKGVLLSRLKPGQFTDEQLERIVARGTDAVFRQCLEIGFFHADPHPGNIFVQDDEVLCFIDCGMTGHVDPATSGLLADLVHGVIEGDLNRVIDVVLTLADADPGLADDRTFRADTWEFISRFQDASLEQLEMGSLLQDFFDGIRRFNLRCPADIVFLIKAITTIEGVGEKLAPQFDIASHVHPHVERLVRRRYGIGALRRRIQDGMLSYADVIERLPANVRSMLFRFRRNRITFNLEHRGLKELEDTIEHASTSIAHAVFVGSLIMGSSVLILGDSIDRKTGVLTIIASVGFAVAVFLVMGRLLIDRFR